MKGEINGMGDGRGKWIFGCRFGDAMRGGHVKG
jgi:hypothetical protein